MISKSKRKSKINRFIVTIVLFFTSIVSFAGCSSNTQKDIENSQKEEVTYESDNKTLSDGEKDLAQSEEEQTNQAEDVQQENDAVKEESNNVESKNIDRYVALIGLSKDELSATLEEEAVKIDEGGAEFEQAGLRVWFDQAGNSTVEQIFLMNSDIDINGAKIGDKISKFKEVLGEPVSDQNGDAHFKYNDVFISINYDTTTEDTYGLYILKNDF